VAKRVDHTGLSRRGLLKGATVTGAAAVGSPLDANAQAPAQPGVPGPITPAPNLAMESGQPREAPIVQGSCGSDYMADVIRSLGIEHVACNPGTSFRGLQESLVNYLKIDWHTCTHEEASVAMANGYAKIEGKPLLTLAHGTVGLQHASMALAEAKGGTADSARAAPATKVIAVTQTAKPADSPVRRQAVDWCFSPGIDSSLPNRAIPEGELRFDRLRSAPHPLCRASSHRLAGL
jgi:thiamine pyrophosphate-dependent enzyme